LFFPNRRIGIIPLIYRDFCREPSILKGETEFRIRTLKKAGIATLPVSVIGDVCQLEIDLIGLISDKSGELGLAVRT